MKPQSGLAGQAAKLGYTRDTSTSPRNYGPDAMHKISACVISFNDEHTIAWSVGSVTWVDEIVVVDTGSTDRTIEIAERLGARIVRTTPFAGFGEMRNRAMERMPQRLGVQPRCRRALHARARGRDQGDVRRRAGARRLLHPPPQLPDGALDPRLRLASRLTARRSSTARAASATRRRCRTRHELKSERPVGWLDNVLMAFPFNDLDEILHKANLYLHARRQDADGQAGLDVERARPRPVDVHPPLHRQARLHRRLGRLRHRAVEFRGDLLSLRQALRGAAGLGRPAGGAGDEAVRGRAKVPLARALLA